MGLLDRFKKVKSQEEAEEQSELISHQAPVFVEETEEDFQPEKDPFRAVIQEVKPLKDGGVAAACLILEGLLIAGDEVYYTDALGRENGQLVISGITQNGKDEIRVASVNSEGKFGAHFIFRIPEGKKEEIHAGYYLQNYLSDNEAAPGLEAIEKVFNQKFGVENKLYFSPFRSKSKGGSDRLEGVGIYDDGVCYHFVTYGLSDLYEKTTQTKEISGLGCELTLSLKKEGVQNLDREIHNICGILKTIAQLADEKNQPILPGACLSLGIEQGFDLGRKSELRGFMTAPNEIPPIDTPFGKVLFVKLVGITEPELKEVTERKCAPQILFKKLGSSVTDYQRKSII